MEQSTEKYQGEKNLWGKKNLGGEDIIEEISLGGIDGSCCYRQSIADHWSKINSDSMDNIPQTGSRVLSLNDNFPLALPAQIAGHDDEEESHNYNPEFFQLNAASKNSAASFMSNDITNSFIPSAFQPQSAVESEAFLKKKRPGSYISHSHQQRKLRKNHQEKQRREEINERFNQLSLLLGYDRDSRVEKAVILSEAIQQIQKLKKEIQNLKDCKNPTSLDVLSVESPLTLSEDFIYELQDYSLNKTPNKDISSEYLQQMPVSIIPQQLSIFDLKFGIEEQADI